MEYIFFRLEANDFVIRLVKFYIKNEDFIVFD